MFSKSKRAAVSFLICAALFAFLLFGGHPIYNSGDDVYLLYLLGGGFGDGPTNLLHYNYGMHPLLGWVIKNFFERWPNINWYSVALYKLHFISCWVWLYVLLSSKKLYRALSIFFIAFFVFESQFLLNITFTNTAMVTAMSGIILLLREYEKAKPDKINILSSMVFITISSLLRLHTLMPLAVIIVPFLVVKIFQKKATLVFPILITGLIIFLFSYYQQQYYSNKISLWKTEESYRQSVLSFYNAPATNETNTATSFLKNGLFWDKQFLSVNKIRELKNHTESFFAFKNKNFQSYLYWLLINNRIFLFALGMIFLLNISELNGKSKKINLSCLAVIFLILIYLLLFKKLPPYLMPALFLFYILLMPLFELQKTSPVPSAKNSLRTLPILTAALFLWSGVRLQKTIQLNEKMNGNFLCAWKEINSFPDKLFIVTDDHFPMDFFSVWDVPGKFMISNLLYKDPFLNNTYQFTYNRFSIISPKDFVNNKDVIFEGKKVTEIENYYKVVWGIQAYFTETDSSFKCIEARQLKF